MRPPPTPPAVYPIADLDALGGDREAVPRAVAELAAAGARWIQVRAKGVGDRRLYELVAACCRLTAGSGALLWVNDRPDVAALLPVAGVHLGQDDLPPRAARAVVGPDVWIGASTHDEEQVARAAADEDVDVVALGPVFATRSKAAPEPVVGLERLARARRETKKPLVAIGGIGRESVARVLAAGADAAAVIGAVCRPGAGEAGGIADRLRGLERAAAEGAAG